MRDRILLIDDSRTIHSFVRQQLADEPVEILSAYDGAAGLRMAAGLQPDLVLLDVEMPSPDGFEVCRELKLDPGTMAIPVIFLTGESSVRRKIEGLNLGAVDYVTKPFDPAELSARVRASLRCKRMYDLLAKRAMIDPLTGLWNRAYLETRLTSETASAEQTGLRLTCVVMDLDHFKAINDRYGHPAGDVVLRQIALLVQGECRGEDVVCRYGGEEFAIVMPDAGAAEAAAVAERVRGAVASQGVMNGRTRIAVTASFGVAEQVGAVGAMKAADRALYRAKRGGRNRVCVAAAGKGRARAA